MKSLRKMFSMQRMAAQPDSEQPEESTEVGPRVVHGVFILTRQPLGDQFKLLEQITALQQSKGYRISLNCISKAAVTQKDLEDKAFLDATLRKEFAKIGGDDLMGRTEVYPCQASGGNSGIYCVIFDRPE